MLVMANNLRREGNIIFPLTRGISPRKTAHITKKFNRKKGPTIIMDKRAPSNLNINSKSFWGEPVNVSNPMHYTDDFSCDKGYFTEEDGTKNFTVKDGCLTAVGDDDGALTYLHIFEKNVSFKARFKYTDPAESNAFVSFVARYNSPMAYVRLSYYHKSGAWAIMASEGKDHPLFRYASTENYRIEPDTWHDIEFVVDGDGAAAYLDGEKILTAAELAHSSPGRVAVAADRLTVFVDSVDVAFLSNQGTLIGGLVHNKLPDEVYREGGSVFEMNDGSLIYTHHNGTTFESHNNGVTWERREMWTNTHGYPNILRLRNGDFIKIVQRMIDGKRYVSADLSSDDGKTWREGGSICITPYKGNTSAIAGNMNDKITQISNGRIFYCQNYESMPIGTKVDGRSVFCEFYYSDDNGMTWTKSETDSWSFGGNSDNDVQWFGECKILECDDGTLRIYNSWNDYGCIVYSESKDGGVTWGPLVHMPEFVCSRSSMQFYRDPYADNETTYYMVWVYSKPMSKSNPMSRSRLSLAKSTDGKNWEFLGDIWRWECNHIFNSHVCHVVDAFVKTTKDFVICGAGCSEHLQGGDGPEPYHHAQRQHIYSIKKSALKANPLPPV